MTDFTSEPTKRRRTSVFKTFARKRRRQLQLIRDSEGATLTTTPGAPGQADERATTATATPHPLPHTNGDNAVAPAADQSNRIRDPSNSTTTPPEAPPQTDDAIPSSSSSSVSLSSSDSKGEDGNIEKDSSSVAATTTMTIKPKGWSCERCTLWNEMKNRRCTVCNARRPPADKLQQQAFAAAAAAAVVTETPRAGQADTTSDQTAAAAAAVSPVVTTQKNDTHKPKRERKVDAKALQGTLAAEVNETADAKEKQRHSITALTDSREGSKSAGSSKKTKSPIISPGSSGRRKKATTKADSLPPLTLNEKHIENLKRSEVDKPSITLAAQENETIVRDTADINKINVPPHFTQQNPSDLSMPPRTQAKPTMASTKPLDENAINSTRMDRDASNLVRGDTSPDNTRTSCLEDKLDQVISMLQLQESKNLRLQDEIQRVQEQNNRLESKMELLLQRQDEFVARRESFRDETESTQPAATGAKPARVSNIGANTPITTTREPKTVDSLEIFTNEKAKHRTEPCAPPERRQIFESRETSDNTLEGQRVAPLESIGVAEKVPAPATNLEDSQPLLSCPSPAASTQTIDPHPPSIASAAKTLDFSSNASRPRQPPLGSGPRLDFVPTAATRLNHNLEQSSSRPAIKPTNNKAAATKPSQPLKNSTNANPKQPPLSAGADGWISNRPTRQFLREMDAGAVPPTNAEANGEWLEARPAKKTNTTATARNVPPPGRQPGGDALWDESQEPGYAYKETVRCKAVREGLPCHDCEQCRKFYQTLKDTGHDFSQDPIHYSRHRSRFTPSETPVDFWELDFIDERDAERQQRQSEGQT